MGRLLNPLAARVAFLATAFVAPLSAFAAGGSLLNPIIPQPGNVCYCPGSAMDWGCVLQVAQGVLNLAVSIGVILMIFWVAYAGVMMVLNPLEPAARKEARQRLLNAVVGMSVMLSSWLIVDFVMKFLYDPNNAQFGPWNEILAPNGNDYCIKPTTQNALTNIGATIGNPLNPGTGTSVNNPNFTTSGACSPASVQQAAQQAGVSIPIGEANTLACLAKPESTCGASLQNYNWGKGSTAYGPFQINLKGNSTCFNNQACSNAAGVSGSLNCQSGFDSHGNPIPGNTTVQACQKAAANLSCSAAAAACVVQMQGYGAWTADSHSSTQQGCINQYASG